MQRVSESRGDSQPHPGDREILDWLSQSGLNEGEVIRHLGDCAACHSRAELLRHALTPNGMDQTTMELASATLARYRRQQHEAAPRAAVAPDEHSFSFVPPALWAGEHGESGLAASTRGSFDGTANAAAPGVSRNGAGASPFDSRARAECGRPGGRQEMTMGIYEREFLQPPPSLWQVAKRRYLRQLDFKRKRVRVEERIKTAVRVECGDVFTITTPDEQAATATPDDSGPVASAERSDTLAEWDADETVLSLNGRVRQTCLGLLAELRNRLSHLRKGYARACAVLLATDQRIAELELFLKKEIPGEDGADEKRGKAGGRPTDTRRLDDCVKRIRLLAAGAVVCAFLDIGSIVTTFLSIFAGTAQQNPILIYAMALITIPVLIFAGHLSLPLFQRQPGRRPETHYSVEEESTWGEIDAVDRHHELAPTGSAERTRAWAGFVVLILLSLAMGIAREGAAETSADAASLMGHWWDADNLSVLVLTIAPIPVINLLAAGLLDLAMQTAHELDRRRKEVAREALEAGNYDLAESLLSPRAARERREAMREAERDRQMRIAELERELKRKQVERKEQAHEVEAIAGAIDGLQRSLVRQVLHELRDDVGQSAWKLSSGETVSEAVRRR